MSTREAAIASLFPDTKDDIISSFKTFEGLSQEFIESTIKELCSNQNDFYKFSVIAPAIVNSSRKMSEINSIFKECRKLAGIKNLVLKGDRSNHGIKDTMNYSALRIAAIAVCTNYPSNGVPFIYRDSNAALLKWSNSPNNVQLVSNVRSKFNLSSSTLNKLIKNACSKTSQA
jgi:hypothetical protein